VHPHLMDPMPGGPHRSYASRHAPRTARPAVCPPEPRTPSHAGCALSTPIGAFRKGRASAYGRAVRVLAPVLVLVLPAPGRTGIWMAVVALTASVRQGRGSRSPSFFRKRVRY
jgi:hypothetical protein